MSRVKRKIVLDHHQSGAHKTKPLQAAVRDRKREYPAMCSPYASHSELGLWISAVMLQKDPSLPIILPLSPTLHKSKPHKERGLEKK